MASTYTLKYSGAETDEAIAIADSIVQEYSSSSTYRVNDLVKHADSSGNTKIWRCGTQITVPEAWNSNKWIETVISKRFSLCDTEAGWTASTGVPHIGSILIYLDVPGIKVADGVHQAKDLNYVGNVTQAEKDAWNNKVRCYLDNVDIQNLIFTTN